MPNHNTQSGSALIVVLLLLSCLLTISAGTVNSITQQTQLIYNYQQHQNTLIINHICLLKVQEQLKNLPDVRLWDGSGLYNQNSSRPLNLNNLEWSSNTSLSINEKCHYIIEYLGEVEKVGKLSKRLLRITTKGISEGSYTRIIQIVYLFNEPDSGSSEIKFTTPPILQQWVEL